MITITRDSAKTSYNNFILNINKLYPVCYYGFPIDREILIVETENKSYHIFQYENIFGNSHETIITELILDALYQ